MILSLNTCSFVIKAPSVLYEALNKKNLNLLYDNFSFAGHFPVLSEEVNNEKDTSHSVKQKRHNTERPVPGKIVQEGRIDQHRQKDEASYNIKKNND